MDSKQAAAIRSQIQQIARAMYGSPPVHGILLVATILSDPNLKSLWIDEVKVTIFNHCFFLLFVVSFAFLFFFSIQLVIITSCCCCMLDYGGSHSKKANHSSAKS